MKRARPAGSSSKPFDFLAACRCGVDDCGTHDPAAYEYDKVTLPETVLPTAYELDLTLQLEKHTFDGVVRIGVVIHSEGLKTIKLHAVDLTLHHAEIETSGAALQQSNAISMDAEEKTASISFTQPLPAGEAYLKITYSGVLNDKMDGFYRSTYTNRHGESSVMASTFFCATTARKCLPCWDEPLRKATFTCSLTVPAHLTALSNTPELSTSAAQGGDGMKCVRFEPTPRMSTYLLAFVVSDLDVLSARSASGVLCRVFTPPGKAQLGQWALDHAVLALDRFADLFGVAYPLPKADLVALPEFSMGAMENWGLVTYRETKLLLAEGASPAQRQGVAETVIHEIAHQWFGNLVTMAWWDDIWLNEGFATWMETHVCAGAHADWQKWDQFVANTQGGALARDALRSSHPIQLPMERAEQVDECFDAISYLKGASVIRMLYAFVGEAAFFEGLKSYMQAFRYGNARTHDLWQCLEAASGKKVGDIASDWTRQQGFPLLTLERIGPSHNGRCRIVLRQEWYQGDGAPVATEDAKAWSIPVFIAGAGAGSARPPLPGALPLAGNGDGTTDSPLLKLMPRFTTVTFSVPCDGRWLKLNAGQHVPLRVKYPDEMVPQLAQAMRAGELPPVDRIGLISDAASLCRAGKLEPALYLELLGTCDAEHDPVVLSQSLERMGALAGLLGSASPQGAAFAKFVAAVLRPQLDALGWVPQPTDGHLTRKLRATVLDLLPRFCRDEPSVCEEARRRFDAFSADPSAAAAQLQLPSDIQAPVFSLVLSSGGEPEFEAMLTLYGAAELDAATKARALAALGSAPTAALRARALELTVTGSVVKAQDIALIPAAVHGASDEGRQAAWEFFKAHHEEYTTRAGGGLSNLMDSLIGACCARFSTEAQRADVAGFFEAHPFPKNSKKIATLLEEIKTSVAYLECLTSGSSLLSWLEQRAASS